MRFALMTVFVLFFLPAFLEATQEKGAGKKQAGESKNIVVDGAEFDFSYLQKTWGLKLKAAALPKQEEKVMVLVYRGEGLRQVGYGEDNADGAKRPIAPQCCGVVLVIP